MNNELVRRHDLALVEQYLRANFKKPPRGVFARFVGESPDYDYRIIDFRSYEILPNFADQRLWWVAVADSYLDRVRVPVSQSWGLFVVHDQICVHLNALKPENLSYLLKLQQDGMELGAETLAALLCDAALSDRNFEYSMLKSVDALKVDQAKRAPPGMDDRSFEKLEALFEPARKVVEGTQTTISFFAHKTGYNTSQIYRMRFVLSREYLIDDIIFELIAHELFSVPYRR